ncbi:MAG: formylglycine-generating enzyme family protein [Planctomycetia bacterium]|nr:formylglycine-generating enzyme family protein [Planctomycetia bacterium]
MYHVSQQQCLEFCQKLRDKGWNVQLPTEAQWEYACRAGTETPFFKLPEHIQETWSLEGEQKVSTEVGWNQLNSNQKVQMVGQKPANAWGFYDMHGNVWEWCLDKWKAYDATWKIDPPAETQGDKTVYRGGSYQSPYYDCRSASRHCMQHDQRAPDVGFRFVLEEDKTP